MKSFIKSVKGRVAEGRKGQKGESSDQGNSTGASTVAAECSEFAGAADLSSLNEVVEEILSAQRSAQLKKHFFSIPPEQYTSKREVRIWTGSFNTNCATPRPDTNLHSWIQHSEKVWPKRTESELDHWSGPDIVIAGFQEINALNASNMLLLPSGAGTENVAAWDSAIDCVLHRRAPEDLKRVQAALESLDAFTGAPAPPIDAAAFEHAFGVDSPRAPGEQIPDHEQYVHVCGRLLVGIYMTVWARKPLAAHISGLQTSEVKTGAGGYLGNKGAVMMRMRVYDTSFCAIAAHLSSGESATDSLRRTADFTMIERYGTFGAAADATSKSTPNEAQFTNGATWRRTSHAAELPNVILLGDLNYRLTMDAEDVRIFLKTRSYERLLARDQLLKEMEKGTAFLRWKEGNICFPPTFKYIKGTNLYIGDTLDTAGDDLTYDRELARSGASLNPALASQRGEADETANGDGPPPFAEVALSVKAAEQPPGGAAAADKGPAAGGGKPRAKSEKVRAPAWTDRILWRSDEKCLHLISYARSEINLSDHKPVMAEFLLQADQVDRQKVNEAIEMSRRMGDLRANQALPRCTLSKQDIRLGRVEYGTSVTCSVDLRNEGEVPATFYFVPLPAQRVDPDDMSHRDAAAPAAISPAWLTVQPSRGVVRVGAAVTIQLTAAVSPAAAQDPGTAERLVQTGSRMDEILILRLEDGSDHFLPVEGSYAPSFFGLSLPTLAGLPRPLNPRDGGQLAPQDFSSEPGPLSMTGDAYTTAASMPFEPAFWAALPWELRVLLQYLARDECLGTEGIFSDSYQLVQAALAVKHHGKSQQSMSNDELSTIADVRRALDAGEGVPESVEPHDVAATLLSYFKALPRPFMPAQISQICKLSVPPAATAAALLKDGLQPTEWGALCCVLHLMKLILRPEPCKLNKHTPRTLASCLAEAWFPPVDLQELEEPADSIQADDQAERLQKMIEMASDINERRADFLQLFLKPGV